VVPGAVSRGLLEVELRGAAAWAAAHGWTLEADIDRLTVTVRLQHPRDRGPLLLVGRFDSYKALPPIWQFVDPETREPTPASFPPAGAFRDGSAMAGKASILHGNRVICAPWNRLAFTENGGPHGDWGGPLGWQQVRGEVPRATNIGEMLAVVYTHLSASPARAA
jgi:hypothetical protein